MKSIVLKNTDIEKIYKSGQCFGISKNPSIDGEYWCVSGNRFCRVVDRGDCSCLLTCFDEDEHYWLNYFDMETDYYKIAMEYLIKDNTNLSKDVVRCSKGLRMLNQELPDCLLSFITSQRKSVPAIRTAIDGFCKKYGKCYKLEDYFGDEYTGIEIYTFPDEDRLERVDVEGLDSLGFGYRSSYILSAIYNMKEDWMETNYLKSCGYDEAKFQLMRLHGVGVKVANCVLLYSLGYKDAYPRDVWIQRFEDEYCNGHFNDEDYKGIAGIIQLWQYHFMMHGR